MVDCYWVSLRSCVCRADQAMKLYEKVRGHPNIVMFLLLPTSLTSGADAVLGHVTGGRGSSSVHREQDIRRMKHSPGSGVLSVSVVPDGPTRILRVVDENKKVQSVGIFVSCVNRIDSVCTP